MGYGDDVYSSPEKHGLMMVAELDDPEASYSFDLLVVWQHEDGRLFYGTDSGCSCPSPFEYQPLDSLTVITDDSWPEFTESVQKHCQKRDVHFDTDPGEGWTRDDLVSRDGITRRRWFRHWDEPEFAVEKVELLAKVSGLRRALASANERAESGS